MEKHGYYWEAMRVTTADDYILTTFHVLGKIGTERNPDPIASVLVQHGATQDGTSMMDHFNGTPF